MFDFFCRLFHVSDWLPTLLSAASKESSVELDEDIDGVDQWQAFESDLEIQRRMEVFHGSVEGSIRC